MTYEGRPQPACRDWKTTPTEEEKITGRTIQPTNQESTYFDSIEDEELRERLNQMKKRLLHQLI